jgi:hypothetical protein
VEDVQDDDDVDLPIQNQANSDEDLSSDDDDNNTDNSEDAHCPIYAREVLSETFLHQIAANPDTV